MTADYRELVGLQAMFDKVVPRYCIVHYYRWKRTVLPEPIHVMRGYDMDRHETIAAITQSVCEAYAPAVLAHWSDETSLNKSLYLQLQENADPKDVGLGNTWWLGRKK